MAANTFISFDHDDQQQVAGFRLLKSNPNHPLEFRDHSLKAPVLGPGGRPLKYPPGDPRSKPVRDEIIGRFERASKLVVLIGNDTWNSDWVTWEINTFYGIKYPASQDKTWKRIRGMTLKGSDQATIPSALMSGRSTQWLAWDPDALDKWLDLDPDA
jgi:hypothetical protein